MNVRSLLYNVLVFVSGCLAVIVPMFFRASMINADETARHEQTMAPGITMFLGIVIAPVGGVAALLILRLVRRFSTQETIQPAQEPSAVPTAAEFAEHNPYAATLPEVSGATAIGEVALLPMTGGAGSAMGFFFGVAIAATIAFGLSLLVLIEPMNHWFHLDGEFDGLFLMLIPPLASGCGGLGGLTYGARYHKRGSLRSGLFVATGLALSISTIYVIGTSDPWPIAALGAVVTGSAMFTVGLLRPLLRHIVRRRNAAMRAKERGESNSCPLWSMCLAVALTVTVTLEVATFLLPRLANMLPTAFMDFTWVFAVALPVLLLLSSYLAAAHPFQSSAKYFLRAAFAVLGLVILRGFIGLL